MLRFIAVLLFSTSVFATDMSVFRRKGNSAEENKPTLWKPSEADATYWYSQAQKTLLEQLDITYNTEIAKNVIVFLGDGMSTSTIAAARALLGQRRGKPGEEEQLFFEKFPHTGFSKTYCVDRQVADSACSATAYLSGVKGNLGTIGVTAKVLFNDCETMKNKENYVYSIAKWSQLAGKRTGLVTTTRVTHASPSGIYAHTASREWECDADVLRYGAQPTECNDIAHQLIHGETGRNLNVILGGGRSKFLPVELIDEEGNPGNRSDSRNLINEWKMSKRSSKYKYVWNRKQLLSVPKDTEYLLGLFDSDHCEYNLLRNQTTEPSLADMTKSAIKLLSKGRNGYFLFVEGGRIDHADHFNQARLSLDETIEFSSAIEAAYRMTNPANTLIVVTSDHSNTITYSGHAPRGNDILGVAGMGLDKLPFATLSYANGPGWTPPENGQRHNISEDDMADPNYMYPAAVPLVVENHGGEDVGIFSTGPWAHLLTGTIEQNVIPHILGYASCVGGGHHACFHRKFS